MGSSDGGGGKEGRWWENPKLSPADLRQHSETWSLADDAAMATLLQSISQRLVSRTHEVEEALEKIVEDSDRIVTNIANINNAFHMLANTQFIENRTYQDDADVAREKQETSEKPPVTEEDILERCRAALEDGLSLVTRSYERHEIQDSDSDDDDITGSPVPVYALIDPYESKPLPFIIGTEGFLADDKVGLEISSSEENSRVTFSPEDTESEEEVEDETDRVTQQQRAIPASSSRALDDDSDSEWSSEEGPMPAKIIPVVEKEKQLLLSSGEEDEMFVSSSRNSKKVDSIISPGHTSDGTIPTNEDSKRTGVDFDSEDEGLFGKEQKSYGIFDKPKQPSKTLEDTKTGISRSSDTLLSSDLSNKLGVENVRAMPVITPTKVSDPSKLPQTGTNLFGSDSDDEDLFSKKSAPSGKISKIPKQNLDKPQVVSSGGLFSSDEESSLFSGVPPTQGPRNNVEDNEEPPSHPKESRRKVPVGGISIFGTAITSALRRQQSSAEESSDDDFKEPNTNSNNQSMPPPSKPSVKTSQKSSNAVKVTEEGGLFESDDEESLFDTHVKRPISITKEEPQSITVSPPKAQEEKSLLGNEPPSQPWIKNNSKSTAGLFSDDDDDLFGISTTTKMNDVSVPETEPAGIMEDPSKTTPAPSKTEESAPPIFTSPPEYPTPSKPVNISEPPKSSHSLFSSPSDDEDFFSVIPKPTQHTQKVSPASAFERDPPPLPPQSITREAELFSKSPTQPDFSLNLDSNKPIKVNVEENSKEVSSLFNSPSDEEDIFSPLPLSKNSQIISALASKEQIDPFVEPQLEKNSATESSRITNYLGKETTEAIPVFPDESFNSCNKKHIKVNHEENPTETSASLFSSPSDEDIFSPDPISKNLQVIPSLPSKEELDPSIVPQLGKESAAMEHSQDESNFEETPEKISVFPNEFPHNNSKQSPRLDQSNSLSKEPSNLSSGENNCIDIISKEEHMANSTEDDLFGFTERLPKPRCSSVKEGDSFSGVTPEVQFQVPSEILPRASEDGFTSAIPRSLKDNPSTSSEGTSDPLSISSSQKECNISEMEESREGTGELAVGTVALFDERKINVQINKQKTFLVTDKYENKQKVDVVGDIHNSEKKNDEQSEDLMFNDSNNGLLSSSSGNLKNQHTCSVPHRESPPFLPQEIENSSKNKNDGFSTKQNTPKDQEISPKVPMKSGNEPNRSPNTTSEVQNIKSVKSENHEEGKEKEIIRRKKPPVGGVSVFGGGTMRNSELFAKVLQRKSMLACESDSSEEDSTKSTDTAESLTLPSNSSALPTEKCTMTSKSVMPASPVSPHSVNPYVFSPDHLEPKSNGDESGISFDDPVTQSNVLQSLNKTRARGSLKRRPPSRAHRIKSGNDPDPSDTPQTSVSSAMPSHHEHHTKVAERLEEPLLENNERRVSVSAEQKEADIACINTKVNVSSKKSDSAGGSFEPVGASLEEKNKKETTVDSKNVHEAPKCPLGISEPKSGSKVKSHSLFDGSDSDEDLFGSAKQKKGTRNPSSSGLTRVPKKTQTKSKSHTLFEDDDDDDASIFSSKTNVNKASAGAARSIPVSKPKGSLKPSSEPFEDPLLGNLKK